MASTVKLTKEKPISGGPRITPRPTAASAARAARNAANRNSKTTTHKSPTRSPPSPVPSKIRTSDQRNAIKSDSRTEVKINRNCENEIYISRGETPTPGEIQTKAENEFVVDNSPQILMCTVSINNEETYEMQNIETISRDEYETSLEVIPSSSVIGEEDRKIPSTPIRSRPQTPKYPSSRSVTPKTSSRPSTPAHPLQKNTTPASRPSTPLRHTTPTKPRTPSTPNSNLQLQKTPNSLQNPPQTPVTKDDNNLTAEYTAKRREFHCMKKELDLKQQAILKVFEGIKNMRERLLCDGIPTGDGPQDLVIFNIADWAVEEITQLCKDATESSIDGHVSDIFNQVTPIDGDGLAVVEAKALGVPTSFAELCLQAFTARQELIDWIKDLVDKNEFTTDDVLERIAQYNAVGLQLCETLREAKYDADRTMNSIVTLTKQVCQERIALMRVGESLVREIARLRQDLETHANIVQIHGTQNEKDLHKSLEESRRVIEEERLAKTSLKEKLTATEIQLKQTRIRVTKMDKQLREAEASIASLTGTVKSLEDQSRQRECNLEARARKLKESLKTGEVTSSQLTQQRNALQTELNELKEQLQNTNDQHKSEIEELNKKLKDALDALQEERENAKKEMAIKQNLEDSLNQSLKNIEELKANIVDLENSRPNPDLPTEREIDLWSELHAAKDTLRIAEEEVIACKREKIRFLESLTKIAESEDKMGMQQKLAAELLSKEEIIVKMQTQIRELTKCIKLNEQKVIQYEQYVQDLLSHNRAVATHEEAPNSIAYQDLQKEVMNLRMSLLDLVHRNEELLDKLAEKDQMLEQQEKTSKTQARVIKVREELINMLKNKETEQSRELIALQQDLEHRMRVVDEVNKQIAAKANEIQDLFSTLENKQQQIHRLEKIVLALEEQQRRSQAQRTRHEEKIAMLEHELAGGINRKERKFIFF